MSLGTTVSRSDRPSVALDIQVVLPLLITSSFNQGIPFHENIEILNPSSLSDSSDDIKTNIYQARTPVGLFI
jgi:hypothetical protein